jgi:hypothetical protein
MGNSLRSGGFLIAALGTLVTLAGCHQRDDLPLIGAQTEALCVAITNDGYATQCRVNALEHAIAIVMDADDEKARELCVEVKARVKPISADLPASWKLQIYSPYRRDKPLAACYLR